MIGDLCAPTAIKILNNDGYILQKLKIVVFHFILLLACLSTENALA